MGTELQKRYIKPGECFEAWNLTHAEQVQAIHQCYVNAGADCLLTHTFQANPTALARHGLQDRLAEIGRAALDNARSAHPRFVLGDIGPLILTELESVVEALRDADALLLETWSDPSVLEAARKITSLSVLVSLTYRRDDSGRVSSTSGHAPEWFAERAADHNIAALGVNCGRDIGMNEIIDIVCRYRRHTPLPLFARPNAGTPMRERDVWQYPLTPQRMAEHLPALMDAGANMIGGCCGTTPEHVAALRAVIHGRSGPA